MRLHFMQRRGMECIVHTVWYTEKKMIWLGSEVIYADHTLVLDLGVLYSGKSHMWMWNCSHVK